MWVGGRVETTDFMRFWDGNLCDGGVGVAASFYLAQVNAGHVGWAGRVESMEHTEDTYAKKQMTRSGRMSVLTRVRALSCPIASDHRTAL